MDDMDYVPLADPTSELNPYCVGAQVTVTSGGVTRRGTIVKWGRSSQANERYLAGGSRDPEILIDNEGPVIKYEDGELDWFPGQSMTLLQPVENDRT